MTCCESVKQQEVEWREAITEADARAKMLMYVVENKRIEMEKAPASGG